MYNLVYNNTTYVKSEIGEEIVLIQFLSSSERN